MEKTRDGRNEVFVERQKEDSTWPPNSGFSCDKFIDYDVIRNLQLHRTTKISALIVTIIYACDLSC